MLIYLGSGNVEKSQLKKKEKILPFQEKLYNNSPVILLTMATERDQEIIDFIDQGNYTYAQSLITKNLPNLLKSCFIMFYRMKYISKAVNENWQ